MTQQAQPSWIGHVINGRYQIETLLGHGGMSSVYRATDLNLKRTVAIKLIHPHLSQHPQFIKRFEQEAQAVAQMRHANIIQVYDYSQENGVFYIVLEYLLGQDLGQQLTALNQVNQRLPLSEVIRIMLILCEAVAYAHEQNIVHRDIKPSNVMLTHQGQPILMDFGIAKMAGASMQTGTGVAIGTAVYMAPEQVRGVAVDHRADIYALGIMLYEMTSGRPPFEGDSALTVMMKHLNDPLPDIRAYNASVPQPLVAIIERALVKEPAQRYQSARDLAGVLRNLGSQSDPFTSRPYKPPVSSSSVPMPPYGTGGGITQQETGIPNSMTGVPPLGVTVNADDAQAASLSAVVPVATRSATNNRPTKKQDNRLLIGAVALCSFLLVAVLGLLWVALTAEETVAPQVGTLRFSDHGETRAGAVSLELERMSLPPAGTHYELWLANNEQLLPLGPLSIEGSRGMFDAQKNENLLATYDWALVSVEPDDDTDESISDEVPFSGRLTAPFLTHVRQLVSQHEQHENGLLPGAEAQALIAVQHAGFLQDALAKEALDEAKAHAEHVVNILDGEGGEFFGDLNGDDQAQNPGDGFGVRAYLTEAQTQIQQARDADPHEDVAFNASQAQDAIAQSLTFLAEATEQALKIQATDTIDEAAPFVASVNQQLQALLEGQDNDGNGVIDPLKGEGAIRAAYEASLMLGEIRILEEAVTPPNLTLVPQ